MCTLTRAILLLLLSLSVATLAVDRPARAADRPSYGIDLTLVELPTLAGDPAAPAPRAIWVAMRQPAFALPAFDPAVGGSLVVADAASPGRCRFEARLGTGGFTTSRDPGGAATRHRYLGSPATGVQVAAATERWVYAGGFLDPWPCQNGVIEQTPRLSIELRIGQQRYCAEFGGSVVWDGPGIRRLAGAAKPTACPDDDLTVANLNILQACPDSVFCRIEDRVDLMMQWIADRGCPDVLTFQEVIHLPPGASQFALLANGLAATCPHPYHVAFDPVSGLSEVLIFSRYPVLDLVRLDYPTGALRQALHARIDHPIGPVDVFSTHLSAGVDGGPDDCGSTGACPFECRLQQLAEGRVISNRECQAVLLFLFFAERHDVDAPAVITGDFNEEPGTLTYRLMTQTIGLVDTHLAAGNPECDPQTGSNCTGGRDNSLAELESRVSNVDRRIDFIFLANPGPGSTCSGRIDPTGDSDGDGIATRTFSNVANPFAPTCGPAPEAICWPSDHNGTELDLNCAP